jgi:transposase
MAYPTIMRERALEALRNGRSREDVKEMFGLGSHTLRDWEKLEEETGSLDKRPLNRKPRLIDLEALRKYCEENPFATHIEAGVHFSCSERVIRYAKNKLGITRKKRHPITQSETSKNEPNSSKN